MTTGNLCSLLLTVCTNTLLLGDELHLSGKLTVDFSYAMIVIVTLQLKFEKSLHFLRRQANIVELIKTNILSYCVHQKLFRILEFSLSEGQNLLISYCTFLRKPDKTDKI